MNPSYTITPPTIGQFLYTANARLHTPVAGGSYLIQENAEEGGTPAHWVNQGANWNFTSAPLEGAASLQISGAVDTFVNFTPQSECWFYCLMNIQNIGGSSIEVIQLNDSGSTTSFAQVHLTTGVEFDVDVPDASHRGTGGTFSSGTTLSVWLHYKAGSGANALGELFVNTSTTKPGSPTATFSTGTSTGNAAGIAFQGAASWNILFDHIRVSSTVIGSNPS